MEQTKIINPSLLTVNIFQTHIALHKAHIRYEEKACRTFQALAITSPHHCHQGALAGETVYSHVQCIMRWCLQKAIAMRPNAIFFSLHCGAKLPNYGLVLACFSLS